MNWDVWIERACNRDAFDIYVCKVQNRRMYVAKPAMLELEEVLPKDECAPRPPFLTIPHAHENRDFFQAFAKALAERGLNLTPEAEATGELKATKEHLSDMQRIAFGFVEKTLGKQK